MNQPDQLFKAFSDATRLRLLNLLAHRPHCVCEFQRILRVPQPKISRHLAYLRRSGLVRETRRGKWIIYALAEPASAVHAAMLRCVRGCFQEIDFLKRDAKRARKAKPFPCLSAGRQGPARRANPSTSTSMSTSRSGSMRTRKR